MTSSTPLDEPIDAGVPREEVVMLEAQELSDVNVSAREREGTSLIDGGERERFARRCVYGIATIECRETGVGECSGFRRGLPLRDGVDGV
jgi:hypothetical protein